MVISDEKVFFVRCKFCSFCGGKRYIIIPPLWKNISCAKFAIIHRTTTGLDEPRDELRNSDFKKKTRKKSFVQKNAKKCTAYLRLTWKNTKKKQLQFHSIYLNSSQILSILLNSSKCRSIYLNSSQFHLNLLNSSRFL